MMALLKNKEGSAALLACIMVLCLVLVFTMVCEYLRIQIIVKAVRDAAQSAVISVSTQNYDKLYNGLREGYAGGYALDAGGNWIGMLDEGDVLASLSNLLGLSNGEKHRGGHLEYSISKVEVIMLNTPFAPGNNDESFSAQVYLTLKVPLAFGWNQLQPAKIRMKVSAGYTPKF